MQRMQHNLSVQTTDKNGFLFHSQHYCAGPPCSLPEPSNAVPRNSQSISMHVMLPRGSQAHKGRTRMLAARCRLKPQLCGAQVICQRKEEMLPLTLLQPCIP